jgi:hypothetical protein
VTEDRQRAIQQSLGRIGQFRDENVQVGNHGLQHPASPPRQVRGPHLAGSCEVSGPAEEEGAVAAGVVQAE